MKGYIKPLAIVITILALLAFAYWYSERQYQAGYDAAESKWQKALNKANAEFNKKKTSLLNDHLLKLEKVKREHDTTIRKIREAKDECLDHTMPAVVVERVRRERAEHSRLPD